MSVKPIGDALDKEEAAQKKRQKERRKQREREYQKDREGAIRQGADIPIFLGDHGC